MCGAATVMPSAACRPALVRVQPDDAVAEPAEPFHRGGQHVRVAAVQPVRADDHDGAAAQPTAAPVPDERVQAGPDPGAALPVDHGLGGLLQRVVRPPPVQRPGDPGQPGAEAEHLDPGRPATRATWPPWLAARCAE